MITARIVQSTAERGLRSCVDFLGDACCDDLVNGHCWLGVVDDELLAYSPTPSTCCRVAQLMDYTASFSSMMSNMPDRPDRAEHGLE